MKKHVVILGAGFAGMELAARLSDALAGEVRITLIDRNDAFTFGFWKLDVMLGRRTVADARLPYAEISKPGVEFRQERVTAIDPAGRRVETDQGTYEADFLAVAMGAGYDIAATPGFAEGGLEFYTVPGAERMAKAIPEFDSGRLVIAILGHPFKCPPAPFEAALLLHDHFSERGVRDAVEITTLGPMAAPVPITARMSEAFLKAINERDISYGAKQRVAGLDADAGRARLASGEEIEYDMFVGIPVHRVPEVVESSGLTEDGWVPVDKATLLTRFDGVYAMGDVSDTPNAKAGVFAEAAAGVVADEIAAELTGGEADRTFDGAGHCYIEFGGGRVGKVEANFFGGPEPTAALVGPTTDLAGEKDKFAAERRERWFGS